jgi:hypothetical protein
VSAGPKLQGMAVAWMREADWPRWLEIDRDFQPDYRHWLKRMEDAVAQLKARGMPVIKVTIDPEEFLAWSKANGEGIGSIDRAAFAVMRAMEPERKGERR